MKRKIVIGLLLMFLVIGTATAADTGNLKMPDGWEAIDDNTYHEIGDDPGSGSGRNMMIEKWHDSLKEDYYNNITDEDYYVYSNGDNTFNYTDSLNGDYGCFEVVELDGEKYFVIFWNVIEADFDSSVYTHDLMMEFNKLNNLEPIAV